MKNPTNENGESSRFALPKHSVLYNLKAIAIIIEVLIGAILGVALCFGFFFSFFILRGNLIVSFGVFFIILIFAAFGVLMLKYLFLLVSLKLREIELLEQILKK